MQFKRILFVLFCCVLVLLTSLTSCSSDNDSFLSIGAETSDDGISHIEDVHYRYVCSNCRYESDKYFTTDECPNCGSYEDNAVTTTKPFKSTTTTNSESSAYWYEPNTYKVGVDIPAGEYYLECISTNLCYFAICADSTGDNILENGNFHGCHYVTLEKGQYFELARGRCTKVSNIKLNINLNEVFEGMYRVGIDIPAGEYKLTCTSDIMAYFAVYDNSSANRDIRENDNFSKNQYITVYEGEYLYLSGCTGRLTAQNIVTTTTTATKVKTTIPMATTYKATTYKATTYKKTTYKETTYKENTTKIATTTTTSKADSKLWTFDEAEQTNEYANKAFNAAKVANDYMETACTNKNTAYKASYIMMAQTQIKSTKSYIEYALRLFQQNYEVDLTNSDYATATEQAQALIRLCDAFINANVTQSNCSSIDLDMWDDALDIMNGCFSMQSYTLSMMKAFTG